jgi:hypothetical protein
MENILAAKGSDVSVEVFGGTIKLRENDFKLKAVKVQTEFLGPDIRSNACDLVDLMNRLLCLRKY